MGRRVLDVRPLRVAAFARLWAAGWVTAVGSQLTAVAVPLEIYGFSGSSADVGLASLAGLVPMVLAARWGGALADVVDRRLMLLATLSELTLPPANRLRVMTTFIGNPTITEALLTALLARGPVLIEGYPGVAKTTLVKAFALTLGPNWMGNLYLFFFVDARGRDVPGGGPPCGPGPSAASCHHP